MNNDNSSGRTLADSPERWRILLVVDDDPLICRMLSRRLSSSFEALRTACTKKEAEAWLGKEEISHLICDYNLGDGIPRGTELVASWRKSPSACRAPSSCSARPVRGPTDPVSSQFRPFYAIELANEGGRDLPLRIVRIPERNPRSRQLDNSLAHLDGGTKSPFRSHPAVDGKLNGVGLGGGVERCHALKITQLRFK